MKLAQEDSGTEDGLEQRALVFADLVVAEHAVEHKGLVRLVVNPIGGLGHLLANEVALDHLLDLVLPHGLFHHLGVVKVDVGDAAVGLDRVEHGVAGGRLLGLAGRVGAVELVADGAQVLAVDEAQQPAGPVVQVVVAAEDVGFVDVSVVRDGLDALVHVDLVVGAAKDVAQGGAGLDALAQDVPVHLVRVEHQVFDGAVDFLFHHARELRSAILERGLADHHDLPRVEADPLRQLNRHFRACHEADDLPAPVHALEDVAPLRRLPDVAARALGAVVVKLQQRPEEVEVVLHLGRVLHGLHEDLAEFHHVPVRFDGLTRHQQHAAAEDGDAFHRIHVVLDVGPGDITIGEHGPVLVLQFDHLGVLMLLALAELVRCGGAVGPRCRVVAVISGVHRLDSVAVAAEFVAHGREGWRFVGCCVARHGGVFCCAASCCYGVCVGKEHLLSFFVCWCVCLSAFRCRCEMAQAWSVDG
mmetsp:Transcript_20458/g.58159  ORF Transcript_20458/g.58159 Transcript_20458/m.58159 type:complete len:472 (-) Transcript_20458:75-1490(-)